ncbi:unnamed protein product [Adineta ricciae]|uniref:G-protein coupled receptors family 1 profile domain-containing protein n=1 Tax=Adineta ricciae TaxID=249248 RepID=A0A815AXU8_ADIRI|nr:unnamed protein product [Adineta ricciae]CAF1262983.1 unnamed protein product [Adineta ricciae]
MSDDSASIKTCLRMVTYLLDYCANGSTSNNETCKHIDTIARVVTVDCYMNQTVYPYVVLFILLVGTILNLLSLYCFLKTNKRNSQNVYLSALSLGDTINLHINFGLPMLRKFDAFDTAFRQYVIVCRLTGILTEFFLIFPTWIVVLLTIERLVTISWPTRNRPAYTQTQAIISVMTLVICVFLLSLYRLSDLKGIDQLSVFSITACSDGNDSFEWVRNVNLIIWTILPECLTFLMSLIIIYQIKSVTRNMHSNSSKVHRSQYNQATKTVLLIAILFLLFHTPTGITIALDLVLKSREDVATLVIIHFSRKITMILYEISLSSKFFIYNRTFRNFTGILSTTALHFTHKRNSAKLGRPALTHPPRSSTPPKIQFNSQHKQSITSPVSQSDSYVKHGVGGGGGAGGICEHQSMLINRHPQTISTNLSRNLRDQQLFNVTMSKTKTNEACIALLRRTDLYKG